jgi:hypothetical protein
VIILQLYFDANIATDKVAEDFKPQIEFLPSLSHKNRKRSTVRFQLNQLRTYSTLFTVLQESALIVYSEQAITLTMKVMLVALT